MSRKKKARAIGMNPPQPSWPWTPPPRYAQPTFSLSGMMTSHGIEWEPIRSTEPPSAQEAPLLYDDCADSIPAGFETMPADPWVHRSSGMRCATCIWFVPKKSTTTKSDVSLGRCRRHAPTMGGYPVVYETDWCGDHRLDENKA